MTNKSEPRINDMFSGTEKQPSPSPGHAPMPPSAPPAAPTVLPPAVQQAMASVPPGAIEVRRDFSGEEIVRRTETATTAAAATSKAIVEAKYIMAMQRPRDDAKARLRILQRCKSPRFAEMAEYFKPVGGKKVTGPSIRLMEEVGRQWGNIWVEPTLIYDDNERRTFAMIGVDLESNFSTSIPVPLEKTVERKQPREGEVIVSSRKNSRGDTTYKILADEDSFLVKQNAALAKARREAIRQIVPGDIVEEALDECRATRASEVKTDPQGIRKRLASKFFALGVEPSAICEFCHIGNLSDLTDAHVEMLRMVYAGLEDGYSWAEVTGAAVQEADSGGAKPSTSDEVKARLADMAEKRKAAGNAS